MSDKIAAISDAPIETALAREYYTSQAIFDQEMEKIFQRQWLLVGHISLAPEPGSYFVKQTGPESMIIVRGKSGAFRAYFNVCRHRGYRMLDDDAAGCAEGIVCPYHRWTYDLNGKLRRVPGTTDGRDFDFAKYPLHEAYCQVFHGFIYVWLGKEEPPALEDVLAFTNHAAVEKAEPEKMKLAHREIYILDANWKSMMENDLECYHCGHGGHTSLAVSCNFQAFYGDDSGEIAGGNGKPLQGEEHFPLRNGMKTFSMDGERVCTKRLGSAPDGYSAGFLLWPLFNGPVFFTDHAVSLELTPISVNKSLFIAEWYVHEDAVEGVDYDVEKLISVFHITNMEDKAFGERNNQGIQSIRFEPGPLHPRRENAIIGAYESYRSMMAAE